MCDSLEVRIGSETMNRLQALKELLGLHFTLVDVTPGNMRVYPPSAFSVSVLGRAEIINIHLDCEAEEGPNIPAAIQVSKGWMRSCETAVTQLEPLSMDSALGPTAIAVIAALRRLGNWANVLPVLLESLPDSDYERNEKLRKHVTELNSRRDKVIKALKALIGLLDEETREFLNACLLND